MLSWCLKRCRTGRLEDPPAFNVSGRCLKGSDSAWSAHHNSPFQERLTVNRLRKTGQERTWLQEPADSGWRRLGPKISSRIPVQLCLMHPGRAGRLRGPAPSHSQGWPTLPQEDLHSIKGRRGPVLCGCVELLKQRAF